MNLGPETPGAGLVHPPEGCESMRTSHCQEKLASWPKFIATESEVELDR